MANKPRPYDPRISVAVAAEALKFVEARKEELTGALTNSLYNKAQETLKTAKTKMGFAIVDLSEEDRDIYFKLQYLATFEQLLNWQASGIPSNFIIACIENPEFQNAIVEHIKKSTSSDMENAFASKEIKPDIPVFSKTEDGEQFFKIRAWKSIKTLWDTALSGKPEKYKDPKTGQIINDHIHALGPRPNIESGSDFELPALVRVTHHYAGQRPQ